MMLSVALLGQLSPGFLAAGCGLTFGNAVGWRDHDAASLASAQVTALWLIMAANDVAVFNDRSGAMVAAFNAAMWLALTRREVRRQSWRKRVRI